MTARRSARTRAKNRQRHHEVEADHPRQHGQSSFDPGEPVFIGRQFLGGLVGLLLRRPGVEKGVAQGSKLQRHHATPRIEPRADLASVFSSSVRNSPER